MFSRISMVLVLPLILIVGAACTSSQKNIEEKKSSKVTSSPAKKEKKSSGFKSYYRTKNGDLKADDLKADKSAKAKTKAKKLKKTSENKPADFDPTYGDDLMAEIEKSMNEDAQDEQELDDFEKFSKTKSVSEAERELKKENEVLDMDSVEEELSKLKAASEQQKLADEKKRRFDAALRRQKQLKILEENQRSMQVYTDELRDDLDALPVITDDDMGFGGLDD